MAGSTWAWGDMPFAACLRTFTKFVPAGILFSKVNLSSCDEVLPAALADLNDLLERQGPLQAFLRKGPAQQSSEHILLQLAVLAMFSMFDITGTSGDQQLRYNLVYQIGVGVVAMLQIHWLCKQYFLCAVECYSAPHTATTTISGNGKCLFAARLLAEALCIQSVPS